ncbi:uncharacterized protein LOC127360334 [Dicentrarchus labrax]|uniref:uncharacterized protein LOC127360334 n=1 Tax=Dicentrarchus labrax TaxID=13489 RepID=UPI0021F69B8A|nr:uncharacterized protein LOC127360334 [Dicentrarchus labrax]
MGHTVLSVHRKMDVWFLLRTDYLDFRGRNRLEVVLKGRNTSTDSFALKILLMLLLERNNILLRSFQAGSALRSKVKNSKLDETGVFGISYKHEDPRRFLSLKRGESLSNAVYLLKELQEQFGTSKIIVFMYDIACRLKPHLQKFYPDLLTKKLTFAVPAFHAYGHDVACQISYSCRNVEGAGLADGEQLERLWSYLRRFVRPYRARYTSLGKSVPDRGQVVCRVDLGRGLCPETDGAPGTGLSSETASCTRDVTTHLDKWTENCHQTFKEDLFDMPEDKTKGERLQHCHQSSQPATCLGVPQCDSNRQPHLVNPYHQKNG